MYRNRKEACDELVRMFKAKEPLLLFIWTQESIRAACNSMHPSDQKQNNSCCRPEAFQWRTTSETDFRMRR